MDKIKIKIVKEDSQKNRDKFSVKFLFFKNTFLSILTGLVFAGLFSTAVYIYAIYTPGETTNPTCYPTDAGCTVSPSAVYSFAANNFSGTGAISGGAITGTSFIIGANTISNFANLKSISNLSDSAGLLKNNGTGTLSWDTTTYLTSADISGKEDSSNKVTSISGSSTDTQYPSAKLLYDQLAGKIGTYGSTTQKYFLAAPNASDGTPSFRAIVAADIPTLNQDTTGTAAKATNLIGGDTATLKGSMPYNAAVNITTMLPPNVTTTKKFLRMTGDGTNGAVPAWDTLATTDIPDISATYSAKAGNASLITTGTVTTGTWNAGVVAGLYGGTGLSTAAVGDIIIFISLPAGI